MKKNILSFILFFVSHVFLFVSAHSQQGSWQWGVRGSGIAEINAVDPSGNLYIGGTAGADLDGVPRNAPYDPVSPNRTYALSSLDCEGKVRWTKEMNIATLDIATDKFGGVYVTGWNLNVKSSSNVPTYIGTDTSFLPEQRLVLIKFDTAGNFLWLRMPHDTASFYSPRPYWGPTEIDPDGNIYIFSEIYDGSYVGGSLIVTTPGYYMFKYDKNGNFIKATRFHDIHVHKHSQRPLAGFSSDVNMKRNHETGHFFFAGNFPSLPGVPGIFNDSMRIGNVNVPPTGTHYLFCADSSGNILWVTPATLSGIGKPPRLVLDMHGDLYVSAYFHHGGTWGGYTYNYPPGGYGGGLPVVIKFDQNNGNAIWGRGPEEVSSTGDGFAISVYNGTVVTINNYHVMQDWGNGFKVDKRPLYGADPSFDMYILFLDAQTGEITGIDSLKSEIGYPLYYDGRFSNGNWLKHDHRGNFYISVPYEAPLYLPINNVIDTFMVYHSNPNVLTVKFGFDNCYCEPPVADYTYNAMSNGMVNFNYTGSIPYSNIVWDMGDGSGQITGQINHTHQFVEKGTYKVCVTVSTTNCGGHTFCDSVESTGLNTNEIITQELNIYPNPTEGLLYVETEKPRSRIDFFNTIGQKVLQVELKKGKQMINLRSLPKGIYMICYQYGKQQERSTIVIY